MVDAVITWVDGADPAHRAKRVRWLAKVQGREAKPRPGTADTRWDSRFELYYCIRLIRRNAPWIQRIFLVTDDQRPDWLTDQEAQRNNVVLVDHKTIFAGHEHVLPTFNSTAIDTVLHRIPGLSERYLYFNDDVFLLRPTREQDYFDGEHGRWRGRFQKRYTVKKLVQLLRWLTRTPKRDGYVGVRKEQTILGQKRMFIMAHAPYPFVRSLTRELIELDGRLERNIVHRFRHWDTFCVPSLLANYGLMQGRARKGPNDWEYIHAHHTEDEILRRLERCRRDEKIKSLCVQSLDMMPDNLQTQIEMLLRECLQKA
ncbi:stealth family protein [Ectothiorhodospira sp. BSL-9]|uniref:stealth family protein n=1 Tax=Ectothiorhodospira sp. BSL-9 TaxID=1442136 RepID=UPI0007B5011E|nr:stealth family protein [Ectothiorhodospira sp. BSL-9]